MLDLKPKKHAKNHWFWHWMKKKKQPKMCAHFVVNWWPIYIYMGFTDMFIFFIQIELNSEFKFSSHRFILILCLLCTWKIWIGRRYSSYRKFFTALLAGKIDLVLMINMRKCNMKMASNKAKAIWKFGGSIRSKVSIKIRITALIQWKIKRNVKNHVYNIYTVSVSYQNIHPDKLSMTYSLSPNWKLGKSSMLIPLT